VVGSGVRAVKSSSGPGPVTALICARIVALRGQACGCEGASVASSAARNFAASAWAAAALRKEAGARRGRFKGW
jgi:hypothetical protein